MPVDGFSMVGVDVGDRVKIVMNDGRKQDILITRVDELGIYGSNKSYAYLDMHSVAVVKKNPTETKHWLLLLLSIAAVSALAEPDSGGYGPFCLRSSTGGPCLP
jgi:hypothetical protein